MINDENLAKFNLSTTSYIELIIVVKDYCFWALSPVKNVSN